MKIAQLLSICLITVVSACGQSLEKTHQSQSDSTTVYKIQKTDAEWRAELTPEQYRILREKGTEYAFSGEYWDHKGSGIYVCAGCQSPLFSSKTKFKSGTGWPSYYEPLDQDCVGEVSDNAYGMRRIEVVCNACGGHLGHVFNDGPQPTGLRYCINSASLQFQGE